MSSEKPGDHIRQTLTDQILSGELPPGHRLDEQQIANRFGLSRTPVREALQQLAASGLLEIKPRRGAFVKSLSQREIMDLFEAMGELEAICARHAAGRMSLMELGHLEGLVREGQRLAEQGDAAGYARMNLAFHKAIFEGAHNESLMEMANILRLRTSPYRNAQFSKPETGPDRLAQSQREHEEILAAIRRRDGDAAHQAMSRHITAASLSVSRIMDGLSSKT
ncbi:GntR family transcriptional regulator [Aestuariispira insulae]|uniref:GntR family transcriptional regulator n=1 Tax=Aestuariispira insulae TaxID=1461337 RepID=A0A3D9HK66_9PROT|nr:GntR family transcriptional regulator [Aestuariispira insulae]RED49897.1 GntR family transcriptional regulator [Aestuariispira insulae]